MTFQVHMRLPIPWRRRLKFKGLSQLPQVTELVRSRPETTESVLIECCSELLLCISGVHPHSHPRTEH